MVFVSVEDGCSSLPELRRMNYTRLIKKPPLSTKIKYPLFEWTITEINGGKNTYLSKYLHFGRRGNFPPNIPEGLHYWRKAAGPPRSARGCARLVQMVPFQRFSRTVPGAPLSTDPAHTDPDRGSTMGKPPNPVLASDQEGSYDRR